MAGLVPGKSRPEGCVWGFGAGHSARCRFAEDLELVGARLNVWYSCLMLPPTRSLIFPAKLGVFLLALCGSIATAFGTTFVVISTARGVVLGIDTKQGNQTNGQVVSSSQICKVVTRKPSAYALAGFTGWTGKNDLYQVLNRASSNDLQATMQAIQAPAQKFLEKQLPNVTRDDLKVITNNGNNPLSIIIGITFKDKGILSVISYWLIGDRTLKPVRETLPNPKAYYYQEANEIDLQFPPFWQTTGDLTNIVRKGLAVGIKADPVGSAYPVSIVSISASAFEQPERPDICGKTDTGPAH